MVQVLPVSPPREKPSLMSKFSRLMIKVSPATTDRGNTRVNFKKLSLKTVVFSILYLGFLPASNLVNYLTGFTDQLSLVKAKSIIDTGSQFANLAVITASMSLPFFFASGIPSISRLALAKDLTCPKYGLVFILGSLLYGIALILGNILTLSRHVYIWLKTHCCNFMPFFCYSLCIPT